jgi:hypothetical protein
MEDIKPVSVCTPVFPRSTFISSFVSLGGGALASFLPLDKESFISANNHLCQS